MCDVGCGKKASPQNGVWVAIATYVCMGFEGPEQGVSVLPWHLEAGCPRSSWEHLAGGEPPMAPGSSRY